MSILGKGSIRDSKKVFLNTLHSKQQDEAAQINIKKPN